MISRRGVAAFLLMAGVVSYAVYDWRKKQDDESHQAEEKKLFHVGEEEVRSLRLRREAGEITLLKTPEGWSIQAPITAPADDTAVEGLVSSLLRSTIEKRLGPVADLESYSLAPPEVEVEISAGEGEGKSEETVRIGEKHPFSGEYYGQIGAETDLLLLSSGVARAREVDLMALREKELIRLETWRVNQLEIQRKDATIRMIRKDGKWNLESPVHTPAADGTVADLISHLGRLKAIRFPAEEPENLEIYGLDAPGIRVSILQEDWREPRRIDFGAKNEAGNLFVRRWDRSAVMEVEESIWPKLNQSVDEFRKSELFLASRWNLTALDLSDAAGEVGLAKNEAGSWQWAGENPASSPVGETVEELLDSLESLRAVAFIDGVEPDQTRFGLAEPRLRVAARTEKKPDSPFELLVGGPAGGERVYVKQGNWPTIYEVPEDQIREVEERISALRAPTPEPSPEEETPAGEE